METGIPLSFLDGLVLPGSVSPTGEATRARADAIQVDGVDINVLVPDVAGRAAPLAYDFASLRAASQESMATVPVDAISTSILLGTAITRAEWVDGFFPRLVPTDGGGDLLASRPTWTYPSMGVEQLDDYDTALGPSQPYRTSGLSVVWLTESIATYGWAVGLTREEMALARGLGLNWTDRKMQLPAWIVRRSLEFQAAARLLDTTVGVTYASGNVTTLGGGAEWDNGGDLLVDVGGAVDRISQEKNVDPADVVVVMTQSAFRAALKDAGYKASLSGVTLIDSSLGAQNVTRVRDYVGAGQLRLINPSGIAGASLLGDRTWVFTQGPNVANYDTSFGHARWSGNWSFNAGGAVEPWEERMIRTTLAAFIAQWKLAVFDASCAELIQNCSSIV